MKKWKPFVVLVIAVMLVIMLIPTLLVVPFSGENHSMEVTDKAEQPKKKSDVESPTVDQGVVKVYRHQKQIVETVPLEEYVAGVVSAEMPADFQLEALKAQALTARTYIVKMKLAQSSKSVQGGADVTDTVQNQVYKNEAELKNIWGKDYQWRFEKVKKAVTQTKGQLLTYKGQPITAAFFSTSNGYTENSEDYWSNALPYLRSVKSEWDKESPKYLSEKTISVAEFESKLGVSLADTKDIGKIIKRTQGNRISEIEISGKRLTGKKIREVLGLKSSDFTWYRQGNQVVVSTKGYGHGVGMSQYGANGMALEGKNYKEIVSYYYQGVTISSSTAFLPTVTAKK